MTSRYRYQQYWNNYFNQGRSQGGSWVARDPPLQAFLNQITWNRWRKCRDVSTWKCPNKRLPSLWHSVTPPLKNPGNAYDFNTVCWSEGLGQVILNEHSTTCQVADFLAVFTTEVTLMIRALQLYSQGTHELTFDVGEKWRNHVPLISRYDWWYHLLSFLNQSCL